MTTLHQHEGARMAMLALLEAELRAALCWLEGVGVQLNLYEAAPLFLSEPRQRAKLVRYVLDQARAFRELGASELVLSWRDDPAMIAIERLTMRRAVGLELTLATAPNKGRQPSASVAERHAGAAAEMEPRQFVTAGFKSL
jgi:hypothetical protein